MKRGFGFLVALGLALGLGWVGLSLAKPAMVERAVTGGSDIIWGGDGPIKMIAPNGVVVLTNVNQTIVDGDYVPTFASVTPSGRYPFFILDLNDVNDGLENWLGVELKASTNNFGMVNPGYDAADPSVWEQTNLVYWTCTERTGVATGGMDPNYAYGTELGANQHVDIRGWVRIKTTMADLMEGAEPDYVWPRKIGILVDPTMLANNDGDWCREGNGNIVWSYMRVSAISHETNNLGRLVWTMCEPVKWFSEIPNWALSGVNAPDTSTGL